MQLNDAGKHLTNIKSRMLFLENSRIVEERSEVTTGNIFHGKVYVFSVLESVQEADKPWSFGGRENIAFDENVSHLYRGMREGTQHAVKRGYLIHLGQCPFAHLF